MIRKFLSKALLSVVMDKSARENLKHKKSQKTAAKSSPSPSRAPSPPPPSPPSAPSSGAMPPRGAKTEDVHQLIMDSLRVAEEELVAKPKITTERQALIQQALDVQRSKAHVLKNLSQQDREKLYVMALKSLNKDNP